MSILKERVEWTSKETFRLWFPVFLWCAWVFLLSSSDAPVRMAQHFWRGPVKMDIPGHLGEFVVLGFLLTRALAGSWNANSELEFGIPIGLQVLILGGLYGMSDEFHQYFVPGRSCALDDFLWDLVSLILGTYSYQLFFKITHLVRQKTLA